MKFIVKIFYNDKGKKLTGKESLSVNIDSNYKPTDIEINKVIESECVLELVERYKVINNGFLSLETGEFVKVNEPHTNSYSSWNSERIYEVEKVSDNFIHLKDYKGSFSVETGLLKCRKKKDIPYISIPSEAEISYYIRNHKRDELAEYLGYNYFDDKQYYSLTLEQLQSIKSIIENDNYER